MNRKICVITGSRADYGLLRWVMEDTRSTPGLALQILATGMHLAKQFGDTWRAIENDGFAIDCKVDMQLGADTPAALTRSMGLALGGCGEALQQLQPDLVLMLGDRFEILSAAAAALVARIPIAHLHGGESTEGAFDESIRHAVTKMSHLHFVAADEYRRRVIQLGEQPERVFMVGGLGVDCIKRLPLLDRAALQASLGFELGGKSLLVTFHPATLEPAGSGRQMAELLTALHELRDTHLIFTMPNADPDNDVIFRMVETFVAEHANARAYTSLGQLRYLSCLRHVDGVVGNSSSGLLEMPSFGKGTINIGERQHGRLRAASVIDCAPERAAITAAIQRLYSPAFQTTLKTVRNPYGDGGASRKIVEVLRDYPLDSILKKPFHNLA